MITKAERKNMVLQVVTELIVTPLVMFGLMKLMGWYIELFFLFLIIVGYQVISAILMTLTQRVLPKDKDSDGK